MSGANWTVTGDKEVIAKFRDRANNLEDFDKATRNSMRRIQHSSFQKAPVDTGFLTSNLVADENRVRTPGIKSGSFDLLDGTEYTLVQEYEHKSQSSFLRDSVWDEQPKYERDIENIAKNGKW